MLVELDLSLVVSGVLLLLLDSSKVDGPSTVSYEDKVEFCDELESTRIVMSTYAGVMTNFSVKLGRRGKAGKIYIVRNSIAE